jgi:hypothetical protein
MEPAQPRFHASTYQMHGHPLARNRARIAEVDRWEEKHGIQLPAAVREWYEFEGNDLWERIRPRDGVFTPEDLKPVRLARVCEKETSGNSDHTFICLCCDSDNDFELVEAVDAYQYLTVYSESDLGIPSLVRIDSSDDPPVYIRPECGDELVFVSPRYSAFQFDQLADERFSRYEDTVIFEVEDRLPNDTELARLRASLSSGPVSQGGWPGWHYRFFTENAFVGSGHTYGEIRELPFWEFRARSNDALVEVLRVVWPIADLAKRLERKVMSLGITIDSIM